MWLGVKKDTCTNTEAKLQTRTRVLRMWISGEQVSVDDGCTLQVFKNISNQ